LACRAFSDSGLSFITSISPISENCGGGFEVVVYVDGERVEAAHCKTEAQAEKKAAELKRKYERGGRMNG